MNLESNPSSDGKLSREQSIDRIESRGDEPWDVIVIGGGATGVGVAMDAATRGLEVLLIERSDFGKGTSSRSTKLVHGGVRYLQQGNITLVRDALRERSLLQQNAPHVVHPLDFVIPCESWFSRFYFWFGLKLYDLLGRGNGFARSRSASAASVREKLPTLSGHGLGGGVIYQDGQFDDTRLLLDMARVAASSGACLVNYLFAESFVKDSAGKIIGVETIDQESGTRRTVRGKAVVNATGPFCDSVRRDDDAACEPLVAASQGAHIVLPRRFFPGDTALIVPKTSDGRVLFLIPWHDHVLVGTTDTAIPHAVPEPRAMPEEIQFLLDTTSEYLAESPQRSDVLSVFTGIRPLVKDDPSARTASLSRDHKIVVSDSGLLTITGGKWTTVRKMSEDVVDRVIRETGSTASPCRTATLSLQPAVSTRETSDRLDPRLPYVAGDVIDAARDQMARTVEDVLARRTRALFLNSAAAIEMAPRVAELMAAELGRDEAWQADQVRQFTELASGYRC